MSGILEYARRVLDFLEDSFDAEEAFPWRGKKTGEAENAESAENTENAEDAELTAGAELTRERAALVYALLQEDDTAFLAFSLCVAAWLFPEVRDYLGQNAGLGEITVEQAARLLQGEEYEFNPGLLDESSSLLSQVLMTENRLHYRTALSADRYLISWLAGEDGLPDALEELGGVFVPGRDEPPCPYAGSGSLDSLEELAEKMEAMEGESCCIQLAAEDEEEMDRLIRNLAVRRGFPVLFIRTERLLFQEPGRIQYLMLLIKRQLLLGNMTLCFTGLRAGDAALAPERFSGYCLEPLRPVKGLLFLITDTVYRLEEERLARFPWKAAAAPLEIREELLGSLEKLWDDMEAAAPEPSRRMGGMIFLYGRKGIGKRTLLKAAAEKKKTPLIFFDISSLMYEPEERIEKALHTLCAESALLQACPCLTGADLYLEAEEEKGGVRRDRRSRILDYMGRKTPLFFVIAEEKEAQMSDYSGRKVCMELPPLTALERIRLWKVFGRDFCLGEEVDLEQSGNKYILTPQGIQDVLSTAKALAARDGEEKILQRHIREAVAQNQKNQLGAYASLINSQFVWDDLILDEEQKRQMRMVCNQLKYRDVVGEAWGFHKKTPYGRGLSVLFYGPPGTGKTMAAQVMANELGLDLYRIDISQMVSKYIGETQKNVSELFRKAKDINALLFFDEADSLFAKRSEAKDSHDRNANAETAHLLQKLEDYEGITILATNYLNNIDDAFKRRIKFIIHIAFPTAEIRLRLWQNTIPREARREEELDLEFFAEHFELSGSSIKEILTNAAYLAASEHRGLANRDLVEAVKLNYAKYGKVLSREDFGYLGQE